MNELATSATVLPSGAAREAASVPMTEAAPGRFSIRVETPLRLTPFLRQHARQQIGAAAGRERYDEFDLPR